MNLFFKKDILFFNQFENTEVYNSGKQWRDQMFGNSIRILLMSSSVTQLLSLFHSLSESTLKSLWKAAFWLSSY